MKDIQTELAILENSPSYREWELLHNVYSAYIRNANDLTELVAIPHNDPTIAIELIHFDPASEIQRSFHQELLRFLINYCATVSTLVDHSRNFMKRYGQVSPDLFQEYEKRRTQVVGLDVAHFVQGLRNYLLHYQFPSVTMSLGFSREPNSVSFDIRLDCAKLSAWDNWKPQARSYLRDKESIVLIDAVHGYTSAIQELYTWLFSQAQETVRQAAVRRMELQTELVHLREPSQQE